MHKAGRSEAPAGLVRDIIKDNMNRRSGLLRRGFTIVELVVIIGIISVLLAIVLANMSEARANARDKERQADLAQIQLAAKLLQQSDSLPSIDETICGDQSACSGPLNKAVRDFIGEVEDPLHGDGEHFYFYDYDASCDGSTLPVIAATMETGAANNATDICNGNISGEDPIGEADAYHIILR